MTKMPHNPHRTTIASFLASGAKGILVVKKNSDGERTTWKDGEERWVEVLRDAVAFWERCANGVKPERVQMTDAEHTSVSLRHEKIGSSEYIIAIAYPPFCPLSKALPKRVGNLARALNFSPPTATETAPPQGGLVDEAIARSKQANSIAWINPCYREAVAARSSDYDAENDLYVGDADVVPHWTIGFSGALSPDAVEVDNV